MAEMSAPIKELLRCRNWALLHTFPALFFPHLHSLKFGDPCLPAWWFAPKTRLSVAEELWRLTNHPQAKYSPKTMRASYTKQTESFPYPNNQFFQHSKYFNFKVINTTFKTFTIDTASQHNEPKKQLKDEHYIFSCKRVVQFFDSSPGLQIWEILWQKKPWSNTTTSYYC